MNQLPKRLDRTFAAISDPTRRAMLARLETDGDVTVGRLAEPFSISLPAILKHLGVLEDAGLVSREKIGRVVTVRLQPEPMRDAIAWLAGYERFWTVSLDRLAVYAERRESDLKEKPE